MATKFTVKKPSKTQVDWIVSIAVLAAACLLLWTWYNHTYLRPTNVFGEQ